MPRNMNSLIAYGSLMSRPELHRQGLSAMKASPVIVKGYRRSFSQEPAWRRGVGNQRGVLTVVPDERVSMNAILLSGLSATAWVGLDERERGYERVVVAGSQIVPFCDTSTESVPSGACLYVGIADYLNAALEPNAEYLRLCVEAARGWGDAFHQTFLETTYVSGMKLADYTAGST